MKKKQKDSDQDYDSYDYVDRGLDSRFPGTISKDEEGRYYIVEKVLAHYFEQTRDNGNGCYLYKIKWRGIH